MKTFLAVIAGLCMVLAGIGLLVSIPAESLPLAAASLGGLLLAGILWVLIEISGRMQIEQTLHLRGETEIHFHESGSYTPETTPDERAAAADLRLRRIGMVAICVIVLAICLGLVHFR